MNINIVDLFIYLCLGALGMWVLWWALRTAAPPEPFNKVLTVVLVVITVILILGPLLGVVAIPHFNLGLRG